MEGQGRIYKSNYHKRILFFFYHLQLGRHYTYIYKMKNRNFIILKFPVPDIWNFHDKKKKKMRNRRGENFLPSFSCFILFCIFFFSPVSLSLSFDGCRRRLWAWSLGCRPTGTPHLCGLQLERRCGTQHDKPCSSVVRCRHVNNFHLIE